MSPVGTLSHHRADMSPVGTLITIEQIYLLLDIDNHRADMSPVGTLSHHRADMPLVGH